MLQLLLSLSSSSNQSYDYIPNQIRDSSTEKMELTWEEVLKDDPLQGDHWQTWPDDNSSNESVSDEDGYEFDEQVTASRLVQQQQQRQRQSIIEPETPINYMDQMDIDNQGDTAALGSLITQQYWRDDFSMEKEDSTQNTALLQNPCQMSDALGNIFYSEAEQRQLRTIPESGIIREVMSLLRGYRGVLFKYEDDHFQVQHTFDKKLA
jgi:gamma-tubulin complex component 5